MKRKSILCIICVMMIAMLYCGSFALTDTNVTTKNTAAVKKNVAEKEIDLSKYKTKKVFTKPSEVKEIAKNYNLNEAGGVDQIIYVPLDEEYYDINESKKGEKVTTREVGGEEWYIKKKGVNKDKRGELIRSSWYRYPSGSMRINDKVEVNVSIDFSAGLSASMKVVKAELTASYGFNVSKSRTVSDTQKITVKKGCKRNLRAYVNNYVYNYELWEDDLIYDDFYGRGKIKKPVGVIFVIGKNIKL